LNIEKIEGSIIPFIFVEKEGSTTMAHTRLHECRQKVREASVKIQECRNKRAEVREDLRECREALSECRQES
jgi:uncharacterized coiled-coil DUF342 family protein